MKIANVVSPAPRQHWARLAAADTGAVVEQTPIWADAVRAAGGYRDMSRLYEFDDGREFVLPLVAKSARGPQTGFASGWGIGGLVGPGLDASVVEQVIADLATHHVLFTHLRPNPLQHQAWDDATTAPATAIAKRAHVVDLAGGLAATEARFRPSGRRGLKYVERAGVQVTTYLGGDGLEHYYRSLYEPSIERWAARQNEPVKLARLRARRRDPLEKLQLLAGTLGDAFRLYMASVDGQLACGNIVLFSENNAHATRGAMDYTIAHKSRAGYAADFAAIKDACAQGCHWYHMGESGENRSLAEYKERFGAQAIDYHEYRIERLPVLGFDHRVRSIAKRLIGFRDT